MKRESRSVFEVCTFVGENGGQISIGNLLMRKKTNSYVAFGVGFVCCAFAANNVGNVKRRLCANALSAIARLFIRSTVFFSLEENCACGEGVSVGDKI